MENYLVEVQSLAGEVVFMKNFLSVGMDVYLEGMLDEYIF